MPRMIRKQVYIEPEQQRLLRRVSEARGVPESVLIREGIERMAAGPRRRGPDRAAWERAKRFIRARGKLRVKQTERGWTREAIYEERIGRYGPPAR
ncbi:MAG: ribbon-helix-helix domain-containing protein [Candidatus Limnocylindria bacterium]